MPDRSYGAATLVADLAVPSSGEAVTVTVTTATGSSLDPVTASLLSGRRYQATVTLPDAPRADGLWQARFAWSTGEKVVDFTVGPPEASYPLADVLVDLAERLGAVWRGVVTDGSDLTLSDPALSGTSADALGLFVLRLPPDPMAGAYRRVQGSDGELLNFDRPFDDALTSGMPYALVPVNPDSLAAAIRRAVAAVAHTGRIPVVAEDLAVTDDQVSIPRGWAAVSRVWADGVALRPNQWRLVPGGKLAITDPQVEAETVSLEGFRDARAPAFIDSPLDLDPVLVAAQASLELLLSRSGGPAVDPEERLRRASLAAQEADMTRRSRRRRVPTNSRPVIW